MKGRLMKSIFLICCLLSGLVQAAVKSPDEVVKETANDVIDRIKGKRLALEANPSQVYELVDELVIPHFDFVSMSKWVLGKNWKAATPEQRIQFTEQFKTLLVRTYTRALFKYSDQQIKLISTEQKANPNLAVVKTELFREGAKPFPIAYRMHQRDEAWKVVDVTVNGVSLVTAYRGSFVAQIKKNGFDALLQQLVDKNKKLAVE